MKNWRLIITILLTSFCYTVRSENLDSLKEKLNSREITELEYYDYSDIDYRTGTEKKRDRKRKNKFGKQFGPLKMGVQVRNTRNSNVNFNLDLIEAYEIAKNSKNLQEFYQSMQADPEDKFISDEIKIEIQKLIDMFWSNFKPKEPEQGEIAI